MELHTRQYNVEEVEVFQNLVYDFLLQVAGALVPLGESTLALDEEMLQVLDVIDPVNPVADKVCLTVNGAEQLEEPPVADSKRENGHGLQNLQERVIGPNGNKPGWRADCKDLAQRLLFSEDSEESEKAHGGPKNAQSVPASSCTNGLSSTEIKSGQQAERSTL